MQSIIEKAIEMAVRNLSAAGCRYYIVRPDGTALGEADLLQPPAQPRSHKKVYKFAQTGYVEQIKSMHVGDVRCFTPPDGAPAEAFQKVLAAKAGNVFGKGNFITTIAGDHVEVLRTA